MLFIIYYLDVFVNYGSLIAVMSATLDTPTITNGAETREYAGLNCRKRTIVILYYSIFSFNIIVVINFVKSLSWKETYSF